MGINALCPMYTYAPAQPQSQQVALSWGDLSLYWPSNTDPGLPTPVWNVHWFYLACLYHAMNIGTGLMDPRGQRLTDQVLGIRVVSTGQSSTAGKAIRGSQGLVLRG